MIKSWADHCSSDEEDSVHDDRVEQELADEAAAQLQVNDAEPVTSDEIVPTDAGDSPPQRVYDFPSQPPFTAFVGNLSYQIKEVSQFTEAVENLAKELLEEPVKVLGGRIAYNRTDPGKHRGFGYVEVETLDQLKSLMTLNDRESMIAGRKVQLDTANHHQNQQYQNNRRGSQGNRGSFQRGGDRDSFAKNNSTGGGGGGDASNGDVDGSKFRGGKYNNANRGADSNNQHRRGGNRNSFKNDGTNNNGGQQQETSGPPPQRPSLKLAPRSKPVEAGRNSTASNIFGGATARDEQAWQERRASIQKEQTGTKEANEQHSDAKDGDRKAVTGDSTGKDRYRASAHNQDRRHSGRGREGKGGRVGRGSGGRGSNDKGENQNKRGSRRNSQQQDKKQQKQPSPEEKAAVDVAKVSGAVAPDVAPKQTEASNKFALLMDSDSE